MLVTTREGRDGGPLSDIASWASCCENVEMIS